MDNKYKELAENIVDKVGGKGNIESVTHCATRLRMVLKDESVVTDDEVKSVKGVLGTVRAGGQYQIIIGATVNKVCAAVSELTGVIAGGTVDDGAKDKIDAIKDKNKEKLVNRISRSLMNMVYPLVPTMAAVGVLKGCLAIFVMAGLLDTTDGTYVVLSSINDAFLYFLPIIMAYSAAKFAGANLFSSMAIGATLVLPAIVTAMTEDGLTFLGIPIASVTYGNSIFPIMITILIAAQFEHFLDKYIPRFLEFLKLIIIVLVMVPLAFLIIGPVFTAVGNILANGTMGVYNLSPILVGVLFGAFWQVCVMFGIHYAFIPIITDITIRDGHNALAPILGMGVWALAGACLGFALKLKDKEKKSLGFTSMTSALFGVTEPSIFGVALPYRKPFVCAMIAGGIAGPLCYVFGVNQYAAATVGGILTFGAHMDPSGDPRSLIGYFACFGISFGIGAILTYFAMDKDAN